MDKSLITSPHYFLRVIGDALRPLDATADLASAADLFDIEIITSDIGSEDNLATVAQTSGDKNFSGKAEEAEQIKKALRNPKNITESPALKNIGNANLSITAVDNNLSATEHNRAAVNRYRLPDSRHLPMHIIDKQKSQAAHKRATESTGAAESVEHYFSINNKHNLHLASEYKQPLLDAVANTVATPSAHESTQHLSPEQITTNPSSLNDSPINKGAINRAAADYETKSTTRLSLSANLAKEKNQLMPGVYPTDVQLPKASRAAPAQTIAQPTRLHIGTVSIKVIDQHEVTAATTHSTGKTSITRVTAADQSDSRAFIRTL